MSLEHLIQLRNGWHRLPNFKTQLATRDQRVGIITGDVYQRLQIFFCSVQLPCSPVETRSHLQRFTAAVNFAVFAPRAPADDVRVVIGGRDGDFDILVKLIEG